MKQKGKKHYEWIKARAKIIKRSVQEGRIEINEKGNIYGRCFDCSKYQPLSPDHLKGRGRGGSNAYENISWLCLSCHKIKHEGMGKKKKSNKPKWAEDHKCINCKQPTRQFICNHCNKVSIRIPTNK